MRYAYPPYIILGIAIPTYLKTKNYLIGNATLEQIFNPMIVYDITLGFGLAIVAVLTHEFVISQLRKRFPKRTDHTKRFIFQFTISVVSSLISVEMA